MMSPGGSLKMLSTLDHLCSDNLLKVNLFCVSILYQTFPISPVTAQIICYCQALCNSSATRVYNQSSGVFTRHTRGHGDLPDTTLIHTAPTPRAKPEIQSVLIPSIPSTLLILCTVLLFGVCGLARNFTDALISLELSSPLPRRGLSIPFWQLAIE